MTPLAIKLVVAHLAGDYLLQSDKDASQKRKPVVLLRHAGWHALTLAIVALTEIPSPRLWAGLLLLLLSHALIDGWTSRVGSPSFRRLMWDQGAHLTAIAILVFTIRHAEFEWITVAFWRGIGRMEGWFAFAGLLAAVWVGGVVVGLWVRPFAKALEDRKVKRDGLERAGRVMGYFERGLVFMAILSGTEALIGFVIAAKALLRLPDARESGSRELSEYYLVGSLASIAWAVGVGLMVRSALRAMGVDHR